MSSGEFRFVAKVNLLKSVLKQLEPASKAKFPKLIKDLEAVMQLRNKLAHSHLDTSAATIAAGHTDRIRRSYDDTF